MFMFYVQLYMFIYVICVVFVSILFSGVTSLPLTTTSRPSLGGENQI